MLRRTIIGCGQTWKLGDRSEKSSITGILDHIVVEQDRLHFIFGLLFSKAIRCRVNEAWHLTFDFKFLYSLGRKTDVTWVGDVKDVSKYGNISTEFFLIVCVCVCNRSRTFALVCSWSLLPRRRSEQERKNKMLNAAQRYFLCSRSLRTHSWKWKSELSNWLLFSVTYSIHCQSSYECLIA